MFGSAGTKSERAAGSDLDIVSEAGFAQFRPHGPKTFYEPNLIPDRDFHRPR